MTEQNRALVRRYFAESVSLVTGPDRERGLAVLDELLTDDFVMVYNNGADADADRGRERHKAFLVSHARNFPKDQWTVEEVVADAEMVACVWHFHGTHKDGNPIDVRAADFYRVRGGRLAELRRFLDFEALQRQIEGSRAR